MRRVIVVALRHDARCGSTFEWTDVTIRLHFALTGRTSFPTVFELHGLESLESPNNNANNSSP